MFGFDRVGDSQTLGYPWCAVEGRENIREGPHDATIDDVITKGKNSMPALGISSPLRRSGRWSNI